MVEFEVGGRTLEMQGAAYTAIAYAEAFGGDVWDAIVALEAKGRVPVAETLRCAWALVKTRDVAQGRQTTPDFAAWVLSLGQVNASKLRSAIYAELADGVLFRTEEEKRQDAERARQRGKRAAEVA